jgi:hypothetical protein
VPLASRPSPSGPSYRQEPAQSTAVVLRREFDEAGPPLALALTRAAVELADSRLADPELSPASLASLALTSPCARCSARVGLPRVVGIRDC